MQPIVHGLEMEFGNQIMFDRRNASLEAGKAVMDAYGIRGHPSYIIVSPDGKVLWSYTGAVAADVLRTQITQSLRTTE